MTAKLRTSWLNIQWSMKFSWSGTSVKLNLNRFIIKWRWHLSLWLPKIWVCNVNVTSNCFLVTHCLLNSWLQMMWEEIYIYKSWLASKNMFWWDSSNLRQAFLAWKQSEGFTCYIWTLENLIIISLPWVCTWFWNNSCTISFYVFSSWIPTS